MAKDSKVLLLLFAVSGLIKLVDPFGELCDSDADCNDVNEERCQRYDACEKGRCVCQERMVFRSDGICSTVKNIGGTCKYSTAGECGDNAYCDNTNKCVCQSSTTANSDNINCDYDNGFGRSCTFSSQCRQAYGQVCKNNACTCVDGAQRMFGVYTRGPNRATTDGCVHTRAKTGLSEGSRCSRQTSTSWSYYSSPALICQPEFVCFLCPEEEHHNDINGYTCLKNPYNAAGRGFLSFSLFSFVVFVSYIL